MFEVDRNKKDQATATEAQQQTFATDSPDVATATQGGIDGLLSGLGQQQISPLGDGALAKFTEATETIEKADGGTDAIRFSHFHLPELALPLLVYSRRTQAGVVFYALLPEVLMYAPMEQRQEVMRNQFGHQGKSIVIDMPVSKCWNDDYLAAAKQVLATEYGVEATAVQPVHYMAVPKSSDINGVGQPQRIYNTARIALKSKANPAPMPSSALLKNAGVDVSVNTEILPGSNVELADGRPTACDALITMTAKEKGRDRSNPHGGGQSLTLSRIAVKFDMLRKPTGPLQAAVYPGAVQTASPENHPILVITGSESYDAASRSVTESPMTPVLGLLSASLLASGRNFESIFQPTAPKGPISRDLGVLGYEYEPYPINFVPAKKEIEFTTPVSKETSVSFRSFMDAYFAPTMTLAVDVGIGTRQSWTQQLMVAASQGKPGANEALIALFDQMTEGKFSALWKNAKDQNLFQGQVCIIHGGQYLLADGSPSDIRHIDYLYALTQAKEAAQGADSPVKHFSDTFYPSATDGAVGLERLDARRKDIVNLEPTAAESVGDTLFVRLFANPELAVIATAALAQAGVNLNPHGLSDVQVTNQLAQGFIPGQAVNVADASNVFRPGFAGTGQQVSGHAGGPIFY